MLDLELALYTRCEHPGRMDAIPACHRGLLEPAVDELLGAPYRITRMATFLQGPVVFLGAEAEFRVHVWVELPEAHPRFPTADRGLIALVQALTAERLVGPVRVEVGWLGAPLPAALAATPPRDWVEQMVRTQGYVDLDDSSWGHLVPGWQLLQVMSHLVTVHEQGMVGRRILERALGFALSEGVVAVGRGDDGERR